MNIKDRYINYIKKKIAAVCPYSETEADYLAERLFVVVLLVAGLFYVPVIILFCINKSGLHSYFIAFVLTVFFFASE
ncbi:MAG: hypothetical protein K6B75_00850, partial [Lachnospiraceae bacterium]|nr:hypothetical protein [Lachnospiraceae bacterium]